ncbi:MAG: F0F1 ATP synthase subunit A [Gemmatimonadaceae bacterium]|nr:F0F1 ATP synthase subunit A [Gemmatimonadaceae bacterium]
MRRPFRSLNISRVALALATAIALLPLGVDAQGTVPASEPQPPVLVPIESATVTASPLPEAQVESQHAPAAGAAVDFITPHITDSRHLEIPWPNAHLAKEIELPQWPPVHIGGIEIDLSPTKHVVFLLLGATLACLMLIGAANASRRQHNESGHVRGAAGGIEALALYLRNEVVLPNVGHHGEKFVPFAMTLFFFILCCNLLGLIPYGSTATGNISVTATLAIITFFVVELAGIRANGLGYLNTMFYWNKELPIVMRVLLFFVMSPVEMLGKLTKPFALMIRLFANMTAGHIVLLAIIGLIFSFQNWYITGAPVLMATAISMLELFVSFLQAFIFTLLASVFIGQIREAHH